MKVSAVAHFRTHSTKTLFDQPISGAVIKRYHNGNIIIDTPAYPIKETFRGTYNLHVELTEDEVAKLFLECCRSSPNQ